MSFTASCGSRTDRELIFWGYSLGTQVDLRAPALHPVSSALCEPYASPCMIHMDLLFTHPFSLAFITHSEWPIEKQKKKAKQVVENFKLGGNRSIFSSSFFIFIPRIARSSLFALRTSCFPLRSSEVTLCAEWLILCDTLQLRTCPTAQQGPRVMVAVTVKAALWSSRPVVEICSVLWVGHHLFCLTNTCR